MRRDRYVMGRGGMAADAAVRGTREVDPAGSGGAGSAEPQPPYSRPPWRRTEELPATPRGT